MSTPHDMDQVKVEAHLGKVEVSLGECCTTTFTRAEALEVMRRLASAIQHAGDICEPEAVFLHEHMRETQERWKDI